MISDEMIGYVDGAMMECSYPMPCLDSKGRITTKTGWGNAEESPKRYALIAAIEKLEAERDHYKSTQDSADRLSEAALDSLADAELGRLVRRLLMTTHAKIVKNPGGEYAAFPGRTRNESGNWYHSKETPEAALQEALKT